MMKSSAAHMNRAPKVRHVDVKHYASRIVHRGDRYPARNERYDRARFCESSKDRDRRHSGAPKLRQECAGSHCGRATERWSARDAFASTLYSSLKYFNSDRRGIARALNESETDVTAARAEEDQYFAAISLGVCPAKYGIAPRAAKSFLQTNIAPR